MERIGQHLGAEIYKLKTTILCFEKILSLPNACFYSKETREYYHKGLESAQNDLLEFEATLQRMPISRRKACLDLSSLPNKCELQCHRRMLLSANDNFLTPADPPTLYGGGETLVFNLRAMKEDFLEALQEQRYSEYEQAILRTKVKQIDKNLQTIVCSKKEIGFDKVGIVKAVKVRNATNFLSHQALTV